MKCSIMLHFIRVYTVCKGEKDIQTKEYDTLKIITLHPFIFTMDYPKVIASNQKEESISIQRVKEATKLENVVYCKGAERTGTFFF